MRFQQFKNLNCVVTWLSLGRSDATEVGVVGERAADGIREIGADERGGIGAVVLVRIVTRQFKFFAGLPPTMLTANHAGHDTGSLRARGL